MIECVLSSNDIRMYYIDGKHVSKEYMKLYVKKFNKNMPYCKPITENTKINRLIKKVKELKDKLLVMNRGITSKVYIDSSIDIQKLKDEISTERINYLKDKDQNKEIISKLISQEKELRELMNKLENEKTIISNDFNNYKKNKEKEINTLKNTIINLETELNTVKNDLEKRKKDILSEEQKTKDLNYKLSESETIINNLREDNSKLNELNDEILGKNKNELEELQIIKIKVKDYENSIEKLKVENKVLRGEINEVKFYTEKEKNEVSGLLKLKEDELLKLKNEILVSINETSILKQQLKDALKIKQEIKVEEPKIEEIEEIKVEEPKIEEIEEIKVEEPKIEEIEEIKVEEPKIEEIEEIKVEEPKIEEIKVEEPKIEEIKVEEPKIEEIKVEEPKIEEIKEDVSDALKKVKIIGKDLEKDISVKYEILEIEKISSEIRDKLEDIRRGNMNVFLESLGLTNETYPILLDIKMTKDNVKRSLKVIDVLLDMTRSALLNLKFFFRNPSILRFMSLNEDDILIDENTKEIINEIYYTKISNDLIAEDISELKSKVKSRTLSNSKNIFITGLKMPLYEKFIKDIIKDSDKGDKRIKTETLLTYVIKVLINLSKLSEKEFVQYTSILSLIMNIIRNSIQNNENLISINNMIIQTKKDELSTLHNSSTNIFTFLRLRSDDVNDASKRFNIKIDAEEKSILIGYDPNINKFYDGDDKLINNNIKYKDNYMFGPFTKIFKPYLTNKEISEDINIELLIKRLKNKKPVMIIGYGSSGSGKTSTLINFFDRNTGINHPGVMIYMSNSMQDEYKALEISFLELEGNIKSDSPVKDFHTIPSSSNPHIFNNQKFIIKNNEWVIDEDNINPLFNTDEIKNKNINIDKDILLRNYIVQIMDNYRNIKATTNNPESSRSHMIIFINFLKDNGENVYLIVCDFAGVENVFNCLNKDVLNNFIEIKNKSNKRFYQEYIDEYIKEKIGNTFEVIENNKKINFSQDDIKTFASSIEKIAETYDALNILKKFFIDKNPKKKQGYKEGETVVRIINITEEQKYKNSKYRRLMTSILNKMKKIDKEDYTTLNKYILDAFKIKDNITFIQLFENSLDYEKAKLMNFNAAENICRDRVKEGLFINDSLDNLRVVISQIIKNKVEKSTIIPPFIDACVSLQCNPYFEDCFGSSFELEEGKSVIMNEIKNKTKEEYNNLSIVVFNVLNISKQANNPPPVPYTDISGLMTELLRLRTLKSKLYSNDFDEDAINPIMDEPYVRKVFLDDILNRETIKKYDKTAQDYIIKLINILREEYTLEQNINNLNILINYINRINAVSSIGTMEFLDMIAKFGLNRTTCNFQVLDDTDISPFIQNFDDNIRDNILKKLKEQRTLLISLFDNLFVQSYFK